MQIIKRFVELYDDIKYKIWLRLVLKELDEWWRYTGGESWQLFPPSFYLTHSKKEIDRILTETETRIQALIDQLGD